MGHVCTCESHLYSLTSLKLLQLLKLYPYYMLRNFDIHSDTYRHTEFGSDWRNSDATETLQCVILSLWMSSRHTHAFQHVLTHAFMHRQTGNKLVNLHRLIFIRFQIRLDCSHFDKKRSQQRSKIALHQPACPSPLVYRRCGMLVLRWIVPLSSDRAGIVWPGGFICTEIPLLRSSALCATSLWLHTQTHRR